MQYRLSLGGREIKSVISVRETVKNDIEEYHSLNGNSFCEPTAKPLRSWDIELLIDGRSRVGEGEELIDRLREIRDSQKAERLTVSSAVGEFSARVLLREMNIRAGYGDCSTVTLQFLEYQKAAAKVSDIARAGSIGRAPANVKAGMAYHLIVQYQNAGEKLRVVNPNTGAEVENLAALNPDMVLKVEKCIGNLSSAVLKLEEKKNKIIGAVYNSIKGQK